MKKKKKKEINQYLYEPMTDDPPCTVARSVLSHN